MTQLQKLFNFLYRQFRGDWTKIIALLLLIGSIGFNFWLYRLEPSATIDPNDNTFQYALVERTNVIWDYAIRVCPKDIFFVFCHSSYLVDHWVHNWAQGYSLPYFYSHIPQIVIVASWRLLGSILGLSLFTYYHWVIYILLCIFPLSVFVALKVLTRNWLTAGIAATLATHLSTDGLYGLDPSSFLWRGYGLSSQLFAMIFMPIGLTYGYRFLSSISSADPRLITDELWLLIEQTGIGGLIQTCTRVLKMPQLTIFNRLHSLPKNDFASEILLDTKQEEASRYYWKAVVFLIATTMGHLGLGIISLISVGFMSVLFILMGYLLRFSTKHMIFFSIRQLSRTAALGGMVVFFLSYWIIPVLLHNNFHNISVWDPVWKFNSYGWDTITKNFLNGDLLDFGRPMILTLTAIFGFFLLLQKPSQAPLAVLFPIWIAMYFGRTTWGSLIDLIPGMKEFHLSRFIVAVHIIALFLSPIGIMQILDFVKTRLNRLIQSLLTNDLKSIITHTQLDAIVGIAIVTGYIFVILPPLYSRSIDYNTLNEKLILQANDNHQKAREDELALFKSLESLPSGRIFAGRGGGWGKDFRIAETPIYMNISTYGFPTVLWLPETWSPNSDTEQYFIEEAQYTYDLYNIRYVVAPADKKPLDFWKLRESHGSWKLYDVATSGYFETGVKPAIVAGDKQSLLNVVRLWIQSDYPKAQLFPEITFDKGYPRNTGLPNFRMINESMYKTPDGKISSLFGNRPIYQGGSQMPNLLTNESVDSNMEFRTKVRVPENCINCILVLKQTFHPNWSVTIDGVRAKPFITFPFYTGIVLDKVGDHEIVFNYTPSFLKMLLLFIALATAGFMMIVQLLKNYKKI